MTNGGAGIAAYRLHKGLQSIGVQSEMLVLDKQCDDISVKVIPDGTVTSKATLDNTPYSIAIRDSLWNRWFSIQQFYPNRPAGMETFSDVETPIMLGQIDEIKNADIIHMHWISGLLNYTHISEAFHGKRIFWTLHDMNTFTGGCHYAGECTKYKQSCGTCPQLGSDEEQDLSRKNWQAKAAAYRNLDITIVTPSKWLALCASESSLLAHFPIEVIPYGFPLDIFKPYPKSEIRMSSNIPISDKIVLFGAHYSTPRKGFSFLAEAFNRIKSMRKDVKLSLGVFGAPPEGADAFSDCSILNFGQISEEHQLALIYSLADVFVMPTIEDNLPNVVPEAMACGLPVVGFCIGGMPDMIDHKKTGYLAAPKNADDLADGIEWVLFSNNDLSAMCREKVEREYSLEKQAYAYISLYKKAIGRQVYQHRSVDILSCPMNEQNKDIQGSSLNEWGEYLYNQDNIDGAVSSFLKAIEVNSETHIAHNNLAIIFLQKGDKQRAIEHLALALSENPTYKPALVNYAAILMNMGKRSEAVLLYERYLKEEPGDQEISALLKKIDF